MADQRRIGAIGESAVEQWALEADLTPNRVRFDDKGWDIFVQADPDDADGSSCLLQVKTTTAANPSRVRGVSLKNWEHLCRFPLPSFFAIVVLGKDKKPAAAYLVHVDRTHSEALRARRPMDVVFGDEHALPALTGAALKAAISSHIKPTYLEYVAAKVEHLRTTGATRHELTVSIPRGDQRERAQLLSDFALGLVDRLAVDELQITPIFPDGELGPVERHSKASVSLTKLPSLGKARIGLSNRSTGEHCEVVADVLLTATMFPSLPQEFQRARFVAGPLSVIVGTGEGSKRELSWSVALNPASRYPLRSLVAPMTLLRMLSQGTSDDLEFTYDLGGSAATVSTIPHKGLSAEGSDLVEATLGAWQLAAAFGLSPDTEVTPPSLVRQARQIKLFAALLSSEPIRGSSVEVTVPKKARHGDPASVAVLVLTSLLLGEDVLVLLVAFVGAPNWTETSRGMRINLVDAQPRILARKIVLRSRWKDFHSGPFVEAAATKLEKEGIALVLRPDPRKP